MLYKELDPYIYTQFISFIKEITIKRLTSDFRFDIYIYNSIYIKDYEDGLPDNHFQKVYYTCICSYGSERDVYPIYKSEVDCYFEDFKSIHRQLRIDKLFE